jgi:hypothetical protein
VDHLLQLYLQPAPAPFAGVYLAQNLHQYCRRMGRPFVYANFVASVDGRTGEWLLP